MVALYETVAEPLTEAQRRRGRASADYVTFTSSSTVRFFFESAGDGSARAGAARRASAR